MTIQNICKGVVFVVALTSLVTVATGFERAACLGANRIDADYVFAPSPTACEDYILCYEGEQYLDTCPTDHRFSAPTQSCRPAASVDCIGCTRGVGVARLPHPEFCDRFFLCSFGRREQFSCPNGLLFDRTVGECNLADAVDCGDRNGGDVDPDQPTEQHFENILQPLSVNLADDDVNGIPVNWLREESAETVAKEAVVEKTVM